MRKKLLAILLCALMILGMGGCSDKNKNNADVTDQEETDQVTPIGSDAATGWVDPQEYGLTLSDLNLDGQLHGQYAGKKIIVLTTGGDQELAVKEAGEYFTKLSGAEVEVRAFGWDDLIQKLQLGLTQEGEVDVTVMSAAFVTGYQKAGLLANISDLMEKYGAPGYDVDDFIPAMINNSCKDGDSIYAIPYKSDMFVLFYRKDLLEDPVQQANYKEATGKELKVPETMDEMLGVANFFTKKFNSDSPTEYGYVTQGMKGSSRWMWTSRLAGLGGNMIDADMNVAFNNDAGKKALDFAKQLIPFQPDEFLQIGYDEVNLLFSSGDAFMAEQWPGLNIACQGSAVDGKVGYAVTPGQNPTVGGWTTAIAKNTQNEEVAYKFVEFMTSKDGEVIKIKHTMDPCRTSNYEREGIKDLSEMYPIILKSLQLGTAMSDVPVPYIGAKLNDICEEWIQKAYSGSVSTDDCISGMSGDFEKALKEEGLID